jgi:DNA-binding MarR family transcriptional regulator
VNTEQQTDTLSAVLGLLEIAHEVRRRLNGEVRALVGLTLEQAVLLSQLDEAGGHMNVSELAVAHNRMPHTISAGTDGLVKMGLVGRAHESTGDRRKVRLTLTPEGRRKSKRFREMTGFLENVVFGNPPPSATREHLNKAIAALRQVFP